MCSVEYIYEKIKILENSIQEYQRAIDNYPTVLESWKEQLKKSEYDLRYLHYVKNVSETLDKEYTTQVSKTESSIKDYKDGIESYPIILKAWEYHLEKAKKELEDWKFEIARIHHL